MALDHANTVPTKSSSGTSILAGDKSWINFSPRESVGLQEFRHSAVRPDASLMRMPVRCRFRIVFDFRILPSLTEENGQSVVVQALEDLQDLVVGSAGWKPGECS